MFAATSPYRYLKVRDLAERDRPREKLFSLGSDALSNAELLAILIGSGIQQMTSIDLAKFLLNAQNNSLSNLSKLSVQELKNYRGIGEAKAASIKSALEISKRLSSDKEELSPKIQSSRAAYELIKPCLLGKVTEEFWVMLINRGNRLIKNYQVSKGGLAKTSADPKVIFKSALEYYAHSLILVHNHPSGNPKPSKADILLTQELLQGAKLLGIQILDHIIFTDTEYVSFADESLI